jgi:hypothetical protein
MAYDIEKTFNSILSFIEDGQSLRSVLKREGMPDSTTFYKWIEKDEQKSIHYVRACESRSEFIFEEILNIADSQEGDIITNKDGFEVVNHDVINRAKLRIEARKWMLGKLQPKKYGDKIQTELSGAITTNIISLGSGIKPT